MHKRIITPLILAVTLFLSSCSIPFSLNLGETIETRDRNTNSSNSIKIDKTVRADSIKLSPYYEKREMTYWYDRLRANEERNLYNAIVNGCDEITDERASDSEYDSYIIAPIKLSNIHLEKRQIFNVISSVFEDNPNLFWLDLRYSYIFDTEGNLTVTLRSYFDNKTKNKCKKQLNAVINTVLEGLDPNMSEFDRELYIHDYIIKNCKYKKSKKSNNHYNAYGCLVEQKAVCEGYNKAFGLLLSYAGVYSTSVSGTDKTDGNVNHVWSAVQLDGDWYHTDVTWDDTKEYSMYDYLNLTTKQTRKTHAIAPDYSDIPTEQLLDEKGNSINYNAELPKCTKTKYNYYKYTGSHLDDMNDNTLAEDLAKAAENREPYFNIYVNPKTMNFRTTYDQLFSDELYTFQYVIKKANKILGSEVLRYNTVVLKKKSLNTINVELYYN